MIFNFMTLLLISCASLNRAPQFDQSKILTWNRQIDESPQSDRPYIAFHKKGPYELYYLAAHHTKDLNSETMKLVEKLFEKNHFAVVIVEHLPFSDGESPKSFLEFAQHGLGDNTLKGGEASKAAMESDQHKIPFYGGEIKSQDLYKKLKSEGFTIEDILGTTMLLSFSWTEKLEHRKVSIDKEGPDFLKFGCKYYASDEKACPDLPSIKSWYRKNMGKELETCPPLKENIPIIGSVLMTHRLSMAMGRYRDQFILGVIEKMLKKYKRIAVVYGHGHYLTQLKSIEAAMGPAVQVIHL